MGIATPDTVLAAIPTDGKYNPLESHLLNNVHPPKPRTDLTNDRIHFR